MPLNGCHGYTTGHFSSSTRTFYTSIKSPGQYSGTSDGITSRKQSLGGCSQGEAESQNKGNIQGELPVVCVCDHVQCVAMGSVWPWGVCVCVCVCVCPWVVYPW